MGKGAAWSLFLGCILACVFSACTFHQKEERSHFTPQSVIPLSGEKEGKDYQEVNAIYRFLAANYLSFQQDNSSALRSYELVSSQDPQSAHLNLVLAKQYLKQGLVFEATTTLGKSLVLEPENREALLLMVSLHMTGKNHSEARVILKDLLEKDSKDEEVMVTWVQLELEDNNHQAAEKIVQNFLKEKKDSGLAYFYLGRLEQLKSNYQNAIAHFKKAMDLRSGFVQAAAYLGILQEAIGDVEGSLSTFAYLAEQTDNAAFHRRVGQIYLDRKESKKALAAFRDYERLDSKDLNNKVKIALLYIELKEYEKAEEKLREIVKMSPESENIKFYLAVVLEQQEKHEESLEVYKSVSSHSKLFPDAVRGMVYVMKQLKRDDAIWGAYLHKIHSTQKDSEFREQLFEIGVNFLVTEKRYEVGRQFVEEALSEFPQSKGLLFSKGTLLEKLGSWKAAIVEMEKIVSLDPENSGALNFIGYMLADNNKELKKAEKYIRKALESRPKDAYIIDSLGWVLFRKGDLFGAEKQLKLALTLKPDESIIADHIGDVLVKMGKLEEAIAYYEKAMELGPETQKEKINLQRKMAEIRTPNKQAHKECERHKSDSCDSILFDSRKPAQAQ